MKNERELQDKINSIAGERNALQDEVDVLMDQIYHLNREIYEACSDLRDVKDENAKAFEKVWTEDELQ